YCYSSKTTITNCYNTGTVSGFSYVGGICGNGLDTYIAKCYNTGTVSGTSSVGGICGSEGTQTNCYNTGTVSGSGYNPSVGGICGENGTQNNCYYLAGCGSKNNLGVSTTADEFASGKITYLLNGSTSGGNIAWRQTLGNGNDAYPVLDNTHAVVYATQPCTSEFSNTAGVVKEHPSMNTIGHCTACDKFITQGTLVTVSNYGSLNLTADFVGYYAISNSAELYWFADKVNTNGGTSMNAVLTADIVVNEKVLKADGTLNGIPTYRWTPIGTSTYRYEGTFDGNGHTISGLYLVYTTNDYYPAGGKCVGLIGYASGATIKNVGVVDSYLYGYQYVGGICGLGLISTNITNCYNTGTVSGYYSYSYAGGICGSCSSSATQTNCYSTGAVSGTNVIGGICGGGGTQTNCYYLAGSCSVSGGGVSATAAELASGKIACLLNNGESTIWRQDLYSDALPSFDVGKNPATGYIVEDGDTYTVVGDMFLATNYEIPEGKTLNVLEGTSLTTTGEAVITNNGTMVCNGTIAGNNLAGNGTFVTNRLSLCSISNLNESYVYKSTDYTLEAGLSEVAVNTTILGKTFTLDATISPSYANNRNVGTATISWTNNADANDVISRTFDITAYPLTISNIKAEGKTYDGNTATTVSYTADVFSGDDVTFGTAATFADKNVGTGKAVSFNYTKSGADAANYAFANETGETTANITPKNLTVSNITANGKVYDGNVTTEGSYSYDADIVDGDDITVNYTAAFEDKNVGTTKRVDFSFTKTGADAGNYQFTNATDHATANITARTLTLSNFVANGKTYDGTTNATGGAFSDNRVSGDVLGFKYDYSFENKNVGTNKNVNFSNIAISGGADKGNYTLAATTGAAKADITVKTLAISNIAAASKTYDGNTTTTVSYTADVFSGDDVTFGTAATFDNKNAGTDKQVTFNYTKSGADAANYAFANESGSTTANIEPRELAISSVSAAGKEYDGNTATTVTIAASNIVSGDVVTFGTAAAFDDKNVGTNKTVNFTYTKSGADAANYSFAQANGTAKANITARTLTLSNFVANGKTYDGTTNATGGAFSDNRVSGDVLQFTYDYSFENKNVGTNKNVNFSNIAISGGADKDNYTLAATTGAAKADITVKTLAISNIKAENKTYDGNTTTSVSYTTDKVATDDVTFGTTATFADKNVGNGKAVSFNYTKSGADAANYAFANATGSTTANITPRELAISSVSAAGKEYDGNTATTVTIAASNIVSGDVVTFGTAAAFADKNVGTNKTVNFTYTKSGADAANYSFAQANGTATAAISARELSLSNFVVADKVYDGTVAGSGSFSDDRVSGDVLEFSYTVEFDDENANTDIDVYFRNIAISGGADKDNYTLLTTSGTGSAKISPVTDEVVITITLADKSVVYSGAEQTYNAADALTIEADNALYNLDWVSESGNAASVSGTNAGEYAFGWNAEMFSNSSANFTNVTFNVTDGKLIITPKTGVVVTITENSSELVYNTEEQSVEGYTYSINDELNIYSEEDFS
ncbi:MAG: hypothetical protein IKO46_02905, partial [Salinivirgaceae bacterium]|nr:hypothetical protein [Salinivirgaceae bacterium]